eukprot:CAMPEP_0168749772 /NCGR_PEP_ID=MMETSP0724-20121128/16897_1 /TAXON_ID=265536 /ORGANISM="Amphiprora sp., Strain CCMP467" /LENGTH=627 /DNA_ID=CAMNT_0008797709 /DNA_START=29 /DNA_END=1912 /DNA_ORIENTATION=+
MVKRQKEKQYLSSRESRNYQSIRAGTAIGPNSSLASSKLPFSHCALTLQPYQTPVCNADGTLFDKDALAGFVWKHRKDPATGQDMTMQDMIVLNMAKDEETGAWQCPILQKSLGDHGKVVAIRQRSNNNNRTNTANVYSYQAYHELNVKAKNYTDLTSGEPFDKKRDVILLNDPDNETEQQQRRNIAQFYHIRHERELKQAADANNSNDNSKDIRHSRTASRVLDKLQKNKRKRDEQQQQQESDNSNKKRQQIFTGNIIPIQDPNDNSKSSIIHATVTAQDVTGVEYNQGAGAASLTSTGLSQHDDGQARAATQEEMLRAQFRVMTQKLKGQKGRVQLELQRVERTKNKSSSGEENDDSDDNKKILQEFSLTLELDCDIAPRTCTNFLGLCAAGKYNGCEFHRVIPRFMMQGGKALQETEDTSLWGQPFRDEFDRRLNHNGPGILSSANAGPHTNQRQFFITFASCPHLDRKHSVFGRVVMGMKQLKEFESQVVTDKQDRPKHEAIVILATKVLENPAQTAADLERERLTELVRARYLKKKKKSNEQQTQNSGRSTTVASKSGGGGVGKYLRLKQQQQQKAKGNNKAKKKKSSSILSNNDDDGGEQVLPRRLPPPPQKTKFQDFSGW